MRELIDREMLRRDIQDYAVCAGKPTLLARHKAMEVIDKIPEAVVRCRECEMFDVCEFGLGADGFCSDGKRKS